MYGEDDGYREISHELSRHRGVGFGQGWRRPFYQVAGTRRRVNGRERAGASMSFLVCDVLLPVWDISGLMTDRAVPPYAILTPRFATFYFDSRFSSPFFPTTPKATRFFIAFHRDIWSRAVAPRMVGNFIGNFFCQWYFNRSTEVINFQRIRIGFSLLFRLEFHLDTFYQKWKEKWRMNYIIWKDF